MNTGCVKESEWTTDLVKRLNDFLAKVVHGGGGWVRVVPLPSVVSGGVERSCGRSLVVHGNFLFDGIHGLPAELTAQRRQDDNVGPRKHNSSGQGPELHRKKPSMRLRQNSTTRRSESNILTSSGCSRCGSRRDA